MTVRCQCPDGHRPHPFTPAGGSWGLCGICEHAVGAHHPDRPNDEVSARIVRLLHVYDLDTWTFHVEPDGGLDVRLRLVPAQSAAPPPS